MGVHNNHFVYPKETACRARGLYYNRFVGLKSTEASFRDVWTVNQAAVEPKATCPCAASRLFSKIKRRPKLTV